MHQKEFNNATTFIKNNSNKYNLIRMNLNDIRKINKISINFSQDLFIIKNYLLGVCYGVPIFSNDNVNGNYPNDTFQVGYCKDLANLLYLDSNKLTFNEKIEWYDRIYYFNNEPSWAQIVNNNISETNIMINYNLLENSITNIKLTYGGTCTKCLQNYPYAEITDISTFKCWGCKNNF